MKNLLVIVVVCLVSVGCATQGGLRVGVAQRLKVISLEDGTGFTQLDEGPESGGVACN